MENSPWNKFVEVFKKLSEDRKNKDLWYAIESWCNELSSDEVIKLDAKQIILYIKQWIGNPWIQERSYDLHNELFLKIIQSFGLPLNWIPDPIKYQINKSGNINKFKASVKEVKTNMKIQYILLIAFVLTGIGVVLYLLVQRGNVNRKYPQGREAYNHSINTLRSSPKSILILVINAKNNERIIQELGEGQVKSTIWENVYRSTKALWIGKKEDFNNSGLSSRFTSPKTAQLFDYDVYFIEIELEKYDRGFAKNADSLERADACERLTQTEHRIRNISQRLSIEAARNPYLYR
ncbi:UNVERIFIED_CONTAM: hypothetical protein BEN50_24350 [Euhalothece sp. KZN 001]